jgi:hypothetical protein
MVECHCMQLYDPRLRFARPLIEHWCSIRRGLEVVPREADLDPREIQGVLPSVSIMEVSDAEASIVAVMGREIRKRFSTDPTSGNWYDFIPAEGAATLKEAMRRLIDTPCGVYYRYRITDQDHAEVTGEVLALPMLTSKSARPSAWISVASIAGEAGVIMPSAGLEELVVEFVDIGAPQTGS